MTRLRLPIAQAMLEVDPDMVIINKNLSLSEGAIAPWSHGRHSTGWYLSLVDSVAKSHGFSAKTPGDCAIAIQRALVDGQVKVRIGLNAGEPIAEEDPEGRGDLFGTSVILASRIAAQATGGEILASNVVRELVAGRGFLFSDQGERVLRGFEDPVTVYEVSWRAAEA